MSVVLFLKLEDSAGRSDISQEGIDVKDVGKPAVQHTDRPTQVPQSMTKPPQQQTMTDQPKYAKCKLDVHNLTVYKKTEYRKGENARYSRLWLS